MSRLQLLQRVSWAAAVAGVLLGLAASGGYTLFPVGSPRLGWWFLPLVLALGVAAGLACIRRVREIDAGRWELVRDPTITKGERELAHGEAERERRLAGIAFLAGPFMVAYWLLYQLTPNEVEMGPAFLLFGALVGYVLGLAVGNRIWEEEPPEF